VASPADVKALFLGEGGVLALMELLDGANEKVRKSCLN
jgi:hypothetical protein